MAASRRQPILRVMLILDVLVHGCRHGHARGCVCCHRCSHSLRPLSSAASCLRFCLSSLPLFYVLVRAGVVTVGVAVVVVRVMVVVVIAAVVVAIVVVVDCCRSEVS